MSTIVSTEEKREIGTSLMFTGLAVWVVDLLVMFFLPAAMKLGRYTTFIGLIAALAVLGLILVVAGYKTRGKSSAE